MNPGLDPAVDLSGLPRVAGRFGTPGEGPRLVVVSGLHGNEPAGVLASMRILEALRGREPTGRGEIVFLVGNRAALRTSVRYVHRDLNRAWTPEGVARARSSEAEAVAEAVAEDREQRELLAELDALIGEGAGPVHVLDLHTTSGGGGCFTTITDTLPNRSLALCLPVPLVVGLEELVEGTLHEYLGGCGCVSIAFESGQHREAAAVDRAEAAIWILLARTGILPASALPELRAARALLAGSAARLPRVVELRHRHAITPADGFRMRPGYRNFLPVRRGEPIADDRQGPVLAPESGRILMPLYQAQGDDGFFVVRDFRPFWLTVSNLLRRSGVPRVVHRLPGIHVHPGRPDALLVNRRVARWYALQLLHLLGFRRKWEEGQWLVVLRQDPGLPARGRRGPARTGRAEFPAGNGAPRH